MHRGDSSMAGAVCMRAADVADVAAAGKCRVARRTSLRAVIDTATGRRRRAGGLSILVAVFSARLLIVA